MARDDFSRDTTLRLAKRVGFRCSNPSCRQATAGPADEPKGTISIGVAAHITAASPGGPRFDVSLSAEERSAIENGIWLCQNCAKLIDADSKQFSVERVLEWKEAGEGQAARELKAVDEARPVISVGMRLVRRDVNIQKEKHDYNLHIAVVNTGSDVVKDYYLELEMPRAVLQGDHPEFVRDRCDETTTFLRATKALPDLYPGDEQIIFKIPYFMNDALFWRGRELLALPVRARLIQAGKVLVNVEVPFKEIQNF